MSDTFFQKAVRWIEPVLHIYPGQIRELRALENSTNMLGENVLASIPFATIASIPIRFPRVSDTRTSFRDSK